MHSPLTSPSTPPPPPRAHPRLLALTVGIATLAACAAPPTLAASPASKKPRQTQPAPQYAASADQPTFTYLDQRTGKLIWTGHAASVNGGPAPGGQPNALFGNLRDVAGTFYQNGSPADHMTAPTVTALQASGVTKVTATGGVVVHSISDPGSTMTCDTAVWNSATNQILGTGHVTLKKHGFTQQGPSILVDAKLRAATMPAPGIGANNTGTIHAHFHEAKPPAR